MTDQELRALVRESIARHAGRDTTGRGPQPGVFTEHPSHVVLALARGSDDDGACVIEPAVRCNHCGYCVSYGH